MDKQQLEEILACLDQRKWLLHFYPDCYAVFLLEQWLKQRGSATVRDIKASPFAKLLNKPILKGLIATQPVLDCKSLDQVWPTTVEPLVVTLGRWAFNQTSRPGFNLVLQVNLNNRWNYALQRMLSMSANQIFDCGHPINTDRETTLGWVRLDLDFDTNEILIEEVQSDLVRWLRQIRLSAEAAQKRGDEQFRFYSHSIETQPVIEGWYYFDSMVMNQWQEALLWSALWFCEHELGIDNIYYHTFDTGVLLKGINYTKPPRSLYTDLPKKFCFELTDNPPQFIAEDKRAKRRLKTRKQSAFYKLAA
ncbi:MAG: hypothetical protein P8X74_14410 [Reinekea sp.]|jgi:hypothetical protein